MLADHNMIQSRSSSWYWMTPRWRTLQRWWTFPVCSRKKLKVVEQRDSAQTFAGDMLSSPGPIFCCPHESKHQQYPAKPPLFNIYRRNSPKLTLYQTVATYTDPVPPSTSQCRHILTYQWPDHMAHAQRIFIKAKENKSKSYIICIASTPLQV